MVEQLWQFSGVNGATGGYSLPPLGTAALDVLIRTGTLPPAAGAHWSDLQLRVQQRNREQLGVKEGVDATDLASAGWGVICPEAVDPAVVAALAPLLQWRQAQAGDLFRLYQGTAEAGGGYRPGESKSGFLARNGVGPGPADPAKMPYFLLLVGGPAEIPFDFQYQLDIQYAVGRIQFAGAAGYATYAEAVVRHERAAARPPVGENAAPIATLFWAPANPDDEPTRQTLRQLVAPLAERGAGQWGAGAVRSLLHREATKTKLLDALRTQPPNLLVTASHGVEFPAGDPLQLAAQGALLGQEWPGPLVGGGQPIAPDHYLAAHDLAEDLTLDGLVAFCLACFGGGTPQEDEFPEAGTGRKRRLAPAPFVAALPMRLLERGALAVVSHVERAWNYSFVWPDAGPQRTVFESALDALHGGKPVGLAMEYFNERYAEIAADLNSRLDAIRKRKKHEPAELILLWTATNDARSYAILGDPAVRLGQAPPVSAPVPAAVAVTAGDGLPAPASPGPAPAAETAAGEGNQQIVRTWVGDPAGGARLLAAESRWSPGGPVETVIAPAFAASDALLAFHGRLVARERQTGTGPASE
jgi:hypothetical protein